MGVKVILPSGAVVVDDGASVSVGSAASEDYVAVASGRVVGGPYKHYDDAKREADRSGGYVQFAAEESRAEDFDSPEDALHHEKRHHGATHLVRIGDGTAVIVYPGKRGRRVYQERGKFHVNARAEPVVGTWSEVKPEDTCTCGADGKPCAEHPMREARSTGLMLEDCLKDRCYRLHTVDGDIVTTSYREFQKYNEGIPELADVRALKVGSTYNGGGGAAPTWRITRLPNCSCATGDCESHASEARLTYAERKRLPRTAFALPIRRELPLTDKDGKLDPRHVANAAARLSMMQNEGAVSTREYESARKKIDDARTQLGLPGTTLAAAEGFAVVKRDEAAVAAGQASGSLHSPVAVYEFVRTSMVSLSQEVVVVVPLDLHGQPLNDKPYLVAMGQRDRVTVNEEDILRPVGDTNAAGFVAAHAHPSNKSRPSPADRELTSRIREATKKAYPSVTFLDHIVVCDTEFYSFAEDAVYRRSKAGKMVKT